MGAVTGFSGVSKPSLSLSIPDAVRGTVIGGPTGGILGATGMFNKLPGSLGPAIGGVTGSAGGINGTGLPGPQGATIQQGVTPDQVNQSYQGTENALAQQQALLDALSKQGGLANQTSAYNQSQNLANQLASAGGARNQSEALQAQLALAGQQQGTANQYQNIANGTGPNPAQAALNNATGQNVANQAALMAGQRGAGANVGLIARQAAQQGAATQQQAVGQSAEMQAQQQLAGLQGLSAQQQAIGATNQNMAGIASQQLAAQQAQQQALAAQAQQQANQQIGATTTLNQAHQAQQQAMLGGLNNQNQSAISSQNSVNAANAGLANTAMQGQQGFIGGILNGAGAAIGALAQGGEVQKYADGSMVAETTPATPPPIVGPKSGFGQFLRDWSSGIKNEGSGDQMVGMGDQNAGAQSINKGGKNMGKGISKLLNKAPTGGDSLAGPDASQMPMDTLMSAHGGLARRGGAVNAKARGQKAVKKGNSYDNDKVPAMLSEQEIVLPRSVTMSEDPVNNAAKFVQAVLAKRRIKK